MNQDRPWWRHGVVYQVYIRSFADENGDSTGDINGLRSRLGYLRDLGVDAVWINPWYKSPLKDGGYDVADYRDIEPRYGTLADAEALISEAHDHGIRIIADLVPNHTSSDHVWFKAALAAPVGDPVRERYHIRPGKGPDGSQPPTDWTSVFGGSAWTRLPDGEWYLHLFDPSQPDLNWEHPEVVDEFKNILRFWLDRGADGFRVDVAHGVVKDMTFPDVGGDAGELLVSSKQKDHPFWDRDGVHEIIRGWRAVLDEYDDRMMVAEAWVHPDRRPLYLRSDEYHQSFDFNFLEAPWDADRLGKVIATSLTQAADVGAALTWVLSNHDVVRHPTRLGLPVDTDWRAWLLDGPHEALDADVGLLRGRAATLFMLGLPGSVYLYQGEELGLPEVWDLPLDVLDDPVWELSGHTRKGRDGCRVPIPWTRDGISLGFGPGPSWLPQPPEFAELSVDAQTGDPESTLEFYREALRLRKEHLISDEELTWENETPPGVIAFARGSGLRCWINMGTSDIDLPAGTTVELGSTPGVATTLPPNCAAWFTT